MVTSISQLLSGPGFLLCIGNFPRSSYRKEPSAKSFWAWRGKGWRPSCFFHHLMFCRYKKVRCLELERSERSVCPQQLCNPRNGDLEILTARACFKDFINSHEIKERTKTCLQNLSSSTQRLLSSAQTAPPRDSPTQYAPAAQGVMGRIRMG